MTSDEIREGFLGFFESKGHTRVPSAPIVPRDDPTLLFINAGMNRFKDVFLGTGRRDYRRVVDFQKCLRVSGKHNDLEEVGISTKHHTFFEMLGNWSFGDYFKREAIAWAWELLTEVWQIQGERLWATVFEGDEGDGLAPDEESEVLWPEMTGIPPERVLRLGKKDNFWEMGDTGPCGPCSEIHYYLGEDAAAQSAQPDLEGPAYTEIWNLVFIQFDRDAKRRLHPLPDSHVDTGMGLERISAILQGVDSNYDTDLFKKSIDAIGEISGTPYDEKHGVAMRVIADHVRALSFAIADGVLPSNEGRGYVLRRILRRAARYGRALDLHEPFIYRLTKTVADAMGQAFPEVRKQAPHIARVIRAEEEGFGMTLDRGIEIFEAVSRQGRISGPDAFRLYDTYGFPLDLTRLMAAEKGLEVDEAGFACEMAEQRTRSREAARGVLVAQDRIGLPEMHSEFVGYETLSSEAVVAALRPGPDRLTDLYLNVTPFYGTSGGQVGDVGRIYNESFSFHVDDTLREGSAVVHRGHVERGARDAMREARVTAEVDRDHRIDTACNHTATHLFHAALRRVLGDHVNQAGSLVSPERLRFDFTHFRGLDPDQKEEIEGFVNEAVRADLAVDVSHVSLDRARELGATMLFTEKYGDVVRMVRIGDVSLELCGGTHVSSTGQIGFAQLSAETGTAAGVRRIEGLTGRTAEGAQRRERKTLSEIEGLLNAQGSDLSGRVSELLARNRELERDLRGLRRAQAGSEMKALAQGAVEVGGARVVAAKVEPADPESFREMADRLREALGSGVGVLGTTMNGKANLIAVVTDDLIRRGLQAGAVLKEVARIVGGGGGGKPHLAQAGGKRPEKMDEALAAVEGTVGIHLERRKASCRSFKN